MTGQVRYVLSFYVELCGGCLWAENDAADKAFVPNPLDEGRGNLPLSEQTIRH